MLWSTVVDEEEPVQKSNEEVLSRTIKSPFVVLIIRVSVEQRLRIFFIYPSSPNGVV